ncbi:hypothetical protein R9C00_24195 [Flammeovirgaceae bacterium SG7u.111]|nr:hypothetical protein [Flammeovirgaceae bacterium SG7u.132]WPO34803.1 hypothetical protein R9C00_24195 [Flammeovirgaceae bacterium SG7u.111]
MRLTNVLISFMLGILCLMAAPSSVFSQEKIAGPHTADTLKLKTGSILILDSTSQTIEKDTTIIVDVGLRYEIITKNMLRSQAFYDSLKSKATKHTLLSELYETLFVEADSQKREENLTQFTRSEEYFAQFSGKTIGNIGLKQVDILEGLVTDTTRRAVTWFAQTANTLHISSREFVIYNNLLFKADDILTPFTLSDNERILRQLTFIQDARILVAPHQDDPQVVDIIVVTQDVFSIGARAKVSGIDNFGGEIYDRNFGGLGHEFSISTQFTTNENPPVGYGVRYRLQNLGGSFVAAEASYSNNFEGKITRLNFQREFLTPQVRYAGGADISWYNTFKNERYPEQQDTTFRIPYSGSYQDLWIGRAFQLKGNNQRGNIVFSGRYFNKQFDERPEVAPDSNYFYHNSSLYMAAVGYSWQKYLTSSMITGYGRTEDLPLGYFLQGIYGYQQGEFSNRPYLGLKLTGLNLWEGVGYFGYTFQTDALLRNNTIEDNSLLLDGIYFSELHPIDRWYIRNFVRLTFFTGGKAWEEPWTPVREFIRWHSGGDIVGNQALSLNLESVLFSPWYFYGFKIALFGFADAAFVGQEKNFFSHNNFFTGVGIGCRVLNESLSFGTIQFSIGFYPQTIEGRSHFSFNFDSGQQRLFDDRFSFKPTMVKKGGY